MKKTRLIVIVSGLMGFFFVFSMILAQEKVDLKISAEVQYEDEPNPIKVQNVQFEYSLYDNFIKWNGFYGHKDTRRGTAYLPSLIYECKVGSSHVHFLKETLLSDIKEIRTGEEDSSFTIFLKDGKSIDAKPLGSTGEDWEFLKGRLPDYYSDWDGIVGGSVPKMVGDLIIQDLGVGRFRLALSDLKEEKVRSIKFDVSDSERWARVSKFSLLLSQALQSFIKADMAAAKDKLNEAITMCQ